MTDKMPPYKYACDRLGLKWVHKTFGVKKWKAELWYRRVRYILFSWCKMFMFYWNVIRMKLGRSQFYLKIF